MPPRLTLFICLCALCFLPTTQGPAQQSDEDERRKRFMKSREEAVQPAPQRPAAEQKAKPKPKPLPPPATKKTAPAKKPAPSSKPQPPQADPPAPALPRQQTPSPLPSPKAAAAAEEKQLVVEKSGFDPKAGLQSPGFFSWFSRWKFLSKSLREQIDKAPVQKARWRYIVVHNSGTRQGNAKAFEYYHTNVRKMPNGLAYHFVIGNGTSSGDGQIEVGSRWRRQINGGHVHSDYLNNIALGICLVGDFNQDKPTQKQLESLDELIRYLRQRVGKIDSKWSVVKAHREINPPRWPTDCPGNAFPYTWLHNRFD